MSGHELMRSAVAGLAGQLRWGSGLSVPAVPSARSVLVCGMGGSGIAGDFAREVASAHGRRLDVHKGYGLPGWAGSEEGLLVVALSYSGNTEETLAAVEAALSAGVPIAGVSSGGTLAELATRRGFPLVTVPGGLQPRAALGFLLSALLQVLAGAGVLPDPRADLDEAASLWDQLAGQGGQAEGLAADLADALDGRIAVVYGSNGPTAPAALRWKTQINENAKWPAWWGLFPELDHNEIVGWQGLADLTRRRVGIVVLRDRDEHGQVEARVRLTGELTSADVSWVGDVWSQGSSMLARMTSLVAVGDLVSLELASRAGVDPVPVDVIEGLKRGLAEGA
jgi:glucose/mannose-6-phosphate isomerase